MLILILFSFLAGVVTILSPCILPILPLVLSGSTATGRSRPVGIVLGFVASFTIFTLFLSTIVHLTNLPSDFLRTSAIIIIFVLGIGLLFPQLQSLLERLFTQLTFLSPGRSQTRTGFLGGIILGLSLGLVWAPCVGPILASVIALAITRTVTLASFAITLAYSLGTAIPLFILMIGGQKLLKKIPFLAQKAIHIQQLFGLLMIGTSLALVFNLDIAFAAYIARTFPQYGARLTALEEKSIVRQKLATLSLSSQSSPKEKTMIQKLLEPNYGHAPDFTGGTQWLNSSPLSLKELKGKVVLVDFWTYTCINCIRTLPYVTGWYEKYKDQGLVVIGVHAPEFEFEKKTENVQKAIKEYHITYPVVQDNDYAIWTAYSNHYWPAEYFIDKDGVIRRQHFGEGQYEESEKFIQQLLAEVNGNVTQTTLEIPEPKLEARTPETYLGYDRMNSYASPENLRPDAITQYSLPSRLPKNGVAFEGNWNIGHEYAAAEQNAALELSFEAKGVYIVMRSSAKSSKARILIDGKVVDTSIAGGDVRNGVVTINEDRLYTLIKLSKPEAHIIRIESIDGNLEVFAFTFG